MIFYLVFASTVFPAACRADEGNALELAVKATFLYRFELYVTWPDNAFPAPDAAFNLCILGSDPFGPLIDRAVAGQSVAHHPIQVVRLQRYDVATRCELLYVAPGDPATAGRAIEVARARPVLTVTDTKDDSTKGVINFIIIDNRVRFEINNAVAMQEGLSISSKLLAVALASRAPS